VPEHQPIGETQMLDLQWENDELEVTFKIGQKPEFELAELSKIKVRKMVHDVTDDEVQEEITRTLERTGNWEDVDDKAGDESQLIVDVVSLDKDGNEVEGEKDIDQAIDLRQEAAAEFKKSLKGKTVGDVVDMKLSEGDETDHFRVTIKKVQKLTVPELSEDLIKEQSNGEASNEDEFRSFIKSRMQQYYDQTSDDLFKNDAVEALVEAHDVDIPDVLLEQILNSYVDQVSKQSGGNLPPDFNPDSYKENMKEQAMQEATWSFISQKLQEKYDDIEIKPEDIDAFISTEAARYGMAPDQLKSYYAQNPNLLDNLRVTIREGKVFDKLRDELKVEEISKDKYRKEQEKKNKKK
jgi:trigger factor